jgi:hypothetical protein
LVVTGSDAELRWFDAQGKQLKKLRKNFEGKAKTPKNIPQRLKPC